MKLKGATRLGLLLAGSALMSLLGGRAQAAVMTAGNEISFGPYTVKVTDCASALCSTSDFAALANHRGFVITASSITASPGPLESTSFLGVQDLTVTFEVTTSSAILSQVLLQVNGSTTGGGSAKVDETLKDGGGAGIGHGNASAGGSAKLIPFSGAPYNDIFLTKDIQSTSFSNPSSTVINSVAQIFDVPEPASAAVLGLAFASLMFVKRQRS